VIGIVLCAAGLAAGAMAMARLRRLPEPNGIEADDAGQQQGLVSVVIPARNEAVTLPRLLRSLAGARPLVRDVIVVDDNSTDATAVVALGHGAVVIRLDHEPPDGWTGKNYACTRGASVATAPLLLFLDADVVLGDAGVARLTAAHALHGGLVSVQPYHAVVEPYEELSAGCNLVSMMGSGAFAAWRDGRRPAAFGPCLMTSADDYARIGGHASVRGEVVEDICLAQRYAACRLPVNVFVGADAVSFRMYPRGPGQLAEGWTKNLAIGSRSAQPLAVIAAAAWLSACLAIGINGLGAALRIGAIGAAEATVACAGWLAVACQVRWMLGRIGSFRPLTSILHPVPLWTFVGLFARSAWHTTVRRSVRWSDRRIDVRHRRAG
jgi:4,4'-diaponeurosporenoate glycosyltransferase